MGVAGVALVAVAFGGYRYYVASQFAASYETYAALASAHSNAAFVPAVEDNPLRRELNLTLARCLSDESLKTADRLELARRGRQLLDEAEKQIDVIGETGEEIENAIEIMEARAAGSARADIVALARERFRIIGDIRGLSYRANFHAAEIFNRIIDDGGKLTDAHVTELNEKVPLVEGQFDERTNLYSELESANSRMENTYAELDLF